MEKFKFGACEQCFPCWGALALKMAHKAGFDGMQITDGGGYLQPHPLNPGFVEYERFGLDLRRKDSYPLTDKYVQAYYLEAAEQYQMQLTGIYLYLLDHQGFMKFSGKTPQGEQCMETIRYAIIAASQMKIPQVTVPMNGMFGVAQHTYAFEKLQYAAKVGTDCGVQVLTSMDVPVERQQEVIDRLDGRVKISFCTIDPLFYAVGAAPQLIRQLGVERIAQFRMKDVAADAEGFVTKETGHPTLLGEGNGSIGACAEAIRESGYSGWILSETPYYSGDLQLSGQDYIALARKDQQTLEHLFNG